MDTLWRSRGGKRFVRLDLKGYWVGIIGKKVVKTGSNGQCMEDRTVLRGLRRNDSGREVMGTPLYFSDGWFSEDQI